MLKCHTLLFFRSTGWLYITMASDGPVDTLGRQCKAMAKAKAKAAVKFDDFIVAYSAELLASEAAGRLRDEHRNAVAQAEMEYEAATAPSPWDDMHVIGEVSPWDEMLPCTNCQLQHSGPCTMLAVLASDMNSLQFYADVLLPARPSLYELRGELYTLMGSIHRVLNFGTPNLIAETYGSLRSDVLKLKEKCDVHI
jgi:hypothetical protein